MNIDNVIWGYIYNILNNKYWDGKLVDVPVVYGELDGDKLGEFFFMKCAMPLFMITSVVRLSLMEKSGYVK